MQSDELTEFYRAYDKWLNEGAVADSPFYRHCGLCANVELFGFINGYSARNLYKEMQQQFEDAGLSTHYPFNQNGDEYAIEAYEDSRQSNHERIQWVKDHAA